MDVNKTLRELAETNIEYVIITGGEPTLQTDLGDVCSVLIDNGYHVTLETNGTIFRDVPSVFVSASPKLKSSYAGDGRELRLHTRMNYFLDSLSKWVKSNDYQLKFVVNDRDDINEIVDIVGEVDASKDKVFLIPQGITSAQFEERRDYIVEFCKTYGFRYGPRLNIDLWGNKRGT